MAFFKFRKSGDEPVLAAPMTESVEAMRRRATFRLIGAGVLVLAAVIGFPMVFDSAPRPMPVDVKIEIPDKNKVPPLAMPIAPNAAAIVQTPATAAVVEAPAVAVTSATAPVAGAPVTVPGSNAKSGKVESTKDEKETILVENKKATEPKPFSKEALKEPVQTPVKEPAKEIAKEVAKPAPKAATPEDGARALALLEGQVNKTAPKPEAKTDKPEGAAPSASGRFVVQVGAFADAAKAKDVRSQLEKAGLKTYTHVAETKEGARTRVRVGPFDDRDAAEATAQKVKALGLPAVILTL